MPIPDENFNVAKFLYYNPELTADLNITSNTQAYEWADSNDTIGMVWNDDYIPTEFSCEAFIIDFKKNLDSSSLNRVIQSAMLKEGFSQIELNERARYIATIYQDVVIEDPNVFRFNYFPTPAQDNFEVSSRNLGVGDSVKLLNTTTQVFEYATVANIIDTSRVLLSNPRKTYDNIGDTYRIIGIRLYDYVRLAKINFLRGMNPPPDVPSEDAIGYIDSSFNPDLYRLLYPDASELSDLKAYYDYINRRDNNERRVGRVADISLDSNLFKPDIDNLNINYRLTIATNGALRWGDQYIYGISEDSDTRANHINQSQDHLITEYAIKQYIDKSYTELAAFNDIVVNGTARFNGIVEITDRLHLNDLYVDGNLHAHTNLIVDGNTTLVGGTHILGDMAANTIKNVTITDATHTGISQFNTDVFMESNLYVAGYTLGPRIGIGPAVPVDYTSTPSGLYDAKLKNAEVRRVLDVGKDLPDGEIALKVNGFVQANNIAYVSDARVKTVHGFISGVDALDIVATLAPISFTYKGACQNASKTKLGFLADDVENIVPEAVSKISQYKVHVDIIACVKNEHTLELQNNEMLELRNGDKVKVNDIGWVEIESCDNETVVLSSALPIENIGSLVKIVKLNVKDVKSIDYPNLVAVMWSALRELMKSSDHP